MKTKAYNAWRKSEAYAVPMTDITALREALAEQQEPAWWPAVENILNEYGLQAIDFVADFKEALALSQQEPYCYVYKENGEDFFAPPTGYVPDEATPLYTSPQPPAQRKPVAWVVTAEAQDGTRRTFAMMGRLKDAKDCCDFGEPSPLYKSPPAQRKPLTDEQMQDVVREAHIAFCLDKFPTFEEALIRKTEAAHGIKGDA